MLSDAPWIVRHKSCRSVSFEVTRDTKSLLFDLRAVPVLSDAPWIVRNKSYRSLSFEVTRDTPHGRVARWRGDPITPHRHFKKELY